MKIFSNFTEQYGLSKTLRFELKPIGATLENLKKQQGYDPILQTFLKDQEVEDAYQVIKPVFDALHEDFITRSLEHEELKQIDITHYRSLRAQLRSTDKKESTYKSLEKDLEKEQAHLRSIIGSSYLTTGDYFASLVGADSRGKLIIQKKGAEVLAEKGILTYIRSHIDDFASLGLMTRKQVSWKEKGEYIITRENLERVLGSDERKGIFENFFTYLTGFQENRRNYYEIKEEKATAVATRIIHDNLPKFVDNASIFVAKQALYEGTYELLASKQITLQTKDGAPLLPITSEIFEDGYFGYCLSQIGIERYNDAISNANSLINLFNQHTGKTETKLPPLKILYKQIGCGEREDFIKIIESPEDLLATLTDTERAAEKYLSLSAGASPLKAFVAALRERSDYQGIYWSKQAITTLSSRYFANWYALQETFVTEKIFKKDTKSEDPIKIPEAIELSSLFEAIDSAASSSEWQKPGVFFRTKFFDADSSSLEIIGSTSSPSQALLRLILSDLESLVTQATVGVSPSLDTSLPESKASIKNWLDSILNITRILKYFVTRESKRTGAPQDGLIENLIDEILLGFDWFGAYDGVRNYLTKKASGELNKLKLNFENSTLAGGWDVNKETDNSCVLLRDSDDHHYLAIIHTKHKKVFVQDPKNPLYHAGGTSWEKMNYKLLPGPNKMLPKVLFSGKWTAQHPTPKEIERIYSQGTFKKGENFSLTDLHTLIDFYKDELTRYPSIEESWQKTFDFEWSDTKSYESIDQYYSEVEKQGYVLDFVSINKAHLDTLVDEGKIYLFQIANKDSYAGATGSKNLHSLYWASIFGTQANKAKLNGEAEIFYRKALPETYKKDSEGNEIIHKESGEKIVADKRYTKEKFLFHCPITLNFCAKAPPLGKQLNATLARDPSQVRFLGIDRGEKHLAYYSLIDHTGQILKQGSLNIPFLDKGGKPRSILAEKRGYERDTIGNIILQEGKDIIHSEMVECWNYNDLLAARAFDRDFARKNWQTIGNIKNLKDGYISQVVHEITKLALEHNALIILENLNGGFKNARKKIEKSVYQKLELALAKKLNFVVEKDALDGAPGSVERAYQLTPAVNNFSDIEKAQQFGIMLYTRANYTSQTDPKTGWRKSIYLKKGKEEDIKDRILEAFDDFGFDDHDYYFRYTDTHTGKQWTLYSGINGKSLDRYKWVRGDHHKGAQEEIDVVKELQEIFMGFDPKRSYKDQILDEGLPLRWGRLRDAIETIQSIRNTGASSIERDEDFLFSPVRDSDGVHYDSRTYYDQVRKDDPSSPPELPISGDANGAYNIARKGIMMLERIVQNPEKPDLFIKDSDWDTWLYKDTQQDK